VTFRPDRHLNVVSLTLYVDNHFIDSTLSAAVELRRLWDDGWIVLLRTDAVGTELATCQGPEKRQMLEDLSAAYPESLGPFATDQSRFDASVVGSDDDEARLDKVFRILFPGVPGRSTANPNHVKDAMHVATAKRYGGDAFVTTEKRLLNKDAAIREAFNGFRIWHPDDALVEAMTRVRRRRSPPHA